MKFLHLLTFALLGMTEISYAGSCSYELIQLKDEKVILRSGATFPTNASFDGTETLNGCVDAALKALDLSHLLSYSEQTKLEKENPEKLKELYSNGGMTIVPDEQKKLMQSMNAVEYGFSDKTLGIQSSGTILKQKTSP